MSRDQARRILIATLDGLVVARADGFDAALDEAGLTDDARRAVTDVEQRALAVWYLEHVLQVDQFLDSFDAIPTLAPTRPSFTDAAD